MTRPESVSGSSKLLLEQAETTKSPKAPLDNVNANQEKVREKVMMGSPTAWLVPT